MISPPINLHLSPSTILHTVEATLGAVQRGLYERFAPLIVQRVTSRL